MKNILQTPYRALARSADTPTIPAWASKRSVYRAGQETLYVAETSDLSAAQSDLDTLRDLGWIVDVKPLDLDGSARITMRRAAESRVA